MIPLGLIPLDIPNNGSGTSTPMGSIALLLIVLVALVVMVGVLFLVRSRRGNKK